MGDPTETIINLVIVGVALFAGGTILLPMLSKLTADAAAGATPAAGTTPVVTTTTTTDANGNVVTTPTTTPLPTNTGNPLTDLINSITNATQGGGTTTPVTPANTGANASLCKSKYFGKCDTECKGGNSSNCTNCRIACGLSSNVATIDDVYSYAGMPMPVGYYVTFA